MDLGMPYIDDIVTVRQEDWSEAQRELADREGVHCGRTTAAAYATIRTVARDSSGATILIIGYDAAWKYLSA